jgi:hypothetical protein
MVKVGRLTGILIGGLCLVCLGIEDLSACQGCKTSLVSSNAEATQTHFSAVAYSVSVLVMLGVVSALISFGGWMARKTLQELARVKRF